MAEGYKPRTLGLVWIASSLTLVATVLRVVGETKGWDPVWFSAESPPRGWFDIALLAPFFGFLFGRRLAQAGSRPPFVAAFFVPMFGLLALIAGTALVFTTFEGEALREKAVYVAYGGPVLALLGMFAWPRAFATTLVYAVLARIPVVVVQFLDVQNGWQTHFRKLPGKLPLLTADQLTWWLGFAQCSFWLPFTVLLAGGFAALGSATVRKV